MRAHDGDRGLGKPDQRIAAVETDEPGDQLSPVGLFSYPSVAGLAGFSPAVRRRPSRSCPKASMMSSL